MTDSISSIDSKQIQSLLDSINKQSLSLQPEKENDNTFGNLLTSAIKDIQSAEADADSEIRKLITGESDDLHSVMLAVEKADMTMKVAFTIRNKLIEAYREIMRMSV